MANWQSLSVRARYGIVKLRKKECGMSTRTVVSKMRNCGMRNAEGEIPNGMCGTLLWNGG